MLQNADHDFGHCPVSSTFLFSTKLWTELVGAVSHVYKYDFENRKTGGLGSYCMQCPGMEMAVQNYYTHQRRIKARRTGQHILKANYHNAD
jgi:hypothetical protein